MVEKVSPEVSSLRFSEPKKTGWEFRLIAFWLPFVARYLTVGGRIAIR